MPQAAFQAALRSELKLRGFDLPTPAPAATEGEEPLAKRPRLDGATEA